MQDALMGYTDMWQAQQHLIRIKKRLIESGWTESHALRIGN